MWIKRKNYQKLLEIIKQLEKKEIVFNIDDKTVTLVPGDKIMIDYNLTSTKEDRVTVKIKIPFLYHDLTKELILQRIGS